MKTLVVSLVLIAVAIASAFFIHNDPGQVIIDFQGVNYETTLGLFLAGLAVAFIGFYILLRLFLSLINAPKALARRGSLGRERKAHESLGAGLVKFNEGNYENAEVTVLNQLSTNKTCDAASYIIAARAAAERKQYDRSSNLLNKARACSVESEIAANVAEAEMLLQRHEYREAIKALATVRKKAPANTHAMLLLAKAYRGSKNWESMLDILRTARRKQAASKEELLTLEREAAHAGIHDAAQGNVQEIFERLPNHLQELPDVIHAYATRLNDMEKGDDAARVVGKALNNSWDEDLAALYGSLGTEDATAQLDQAERWHKENGDSMSLLLALGNLSYRRNLWGKAKDYILKSIAIKPTPNAFFSLGKTLEAMDDSDGAMEAYKHGYALNPEIVIPQATATPTTLENPAKIDASREASASPSPA